MSKFRFAGGTTTCPSSTRDNPVASASTSKLDARSSTLSSNISAASAATIDSQTNRPVPSSTLPLNNNDIKGKGKGALDNWSSRAISGDIVKVEQSTSTLQKYGNVPYFPFGDPSASVANMPTVASASHVTNTATPITAQTVHAALPTSILARRKSSSSSAKATNSPHFGGSVARPMTPRTNSVVPLKRSGTAKSASGSSTPPPAAQKSNNDEEYEVDEFDFDGGLEDQLQRGDENRNPNSRSSKPPSPKRARPSFDSGYGAGDRTLDMAMMVEGVELVGPTPLPEEHRVISDSEGESEPLTSEADPTARSTVSQRGERDRLVQAAREAERAKLVSPPLQKEGETNDGPALEIVERDLSRLTNRRIALLEECLELLNSGTTFTESGNDEQMLRNNLDYVAEKTQEQRAMLLQRGGKLSDLQIMLEKRASLLDELIEIQTNGTGLSSTGSDKAFIDHQLTYVDSRITSLRAQSTATGSNTPQAVNSPRALAQVLKNQSAASSFSTTSSKKFDVVPRLSISSLPQLTGPEKRPPSLVSHNPDTVGAIQQSSLKVTSIPCSSGSSSSINSATKQSLAQRSPPSTTSSSTLTNDPSKEISKVSDPPKAPTTTTSTSKFRPVGDRASFNPLNSTPSSLAEPIVNTALTVPEPARLLPQQVTSTSRASHSASRPLPPSKRGPAASTSKTIVLDDDFAGIDFDEPLTIDDDDDDDEAMHKVMSQPRQQNKPAHLAGKNLNLSSVKSRPPSKMVDDDSDPARALEAPKSNHPWSRDVAKALRQRFGLTRFRANQEDAINATLSGKDVFVLLPTGGGKSLCFQLPAVISTGTTKGLTIVVSPLLSLISDQTKALIDKDIPVVFLNSTMPAADRKFAMDAIRADPPTACLAYVTPEQIVKSDAFRSMLRELHRRDQLARFVIDEAHCVSSWGHDFRPDYKEMGTLKKDFPRIPLIALTATANDRVKNDVIANLHMRSPLVLSQSFNRKNLRYEVRPKTKGITEEIAKVIRMNFSGKCGIIYCMSKKQCEDTAKTLREKHSIGAQHYHAGMNKDDRLRIQEGWQRNEFHVICATIAFGMGIDKPDVRYVIHYSLSQSLEAYYQETGRAGRDGATSTCILYFAYGDTKLMNRLIDEGDGTPEQKENNRANVRRVVQYCMNETDCRRVQVLRYFGDNDFTTEMCHKTCDNCLAGRNVEKRDVTDIAQDAIRLVQSIERDKGVTMLYAIDVFRGSKSAKITSKGHDQMQYAGKGSKMERGDVERLFQLLASEAALGERFERNALGFTNAYITVGPRANEILKGKRKLEMGVSSAKRNADAGANGKDKGKGKGRVAVAPQRPQDYFEDDEDYIEVDDPDEINHQDEVDPLTSPAATARSNRRSTGSGNAYDVDSVLARLINCRAQFALQEDCDENQLMSDTAMQKVAELLPHAEEELARIPGCDSREMFEWYLESNCRMICADARTGRAAHSSASMHSRHAALASKRTKTMAVSACGTISAGGSSTKSAPGRKPTDTRNKQSTTTGATKQLNIGRFALGSVDRDVVGDAGGRSLKRGNGAPTGARNDGKGGIRAMPIPRR